MKRAQTTHRNRGFLLLVVVGVLAVILTVCVGFLAYTRGEVSAAAHVRDKNDGKDLMLSSLDWTLANITGDLMPGGRFDATDRGLVSNARTPSEKGYRWWYRPYEKDLKDRFAAWPYRPQAATTGIPFLSYSGDPAWGNKARPDCVDANGRDQAEWFYLPEDVLPTSGIHARAMVQVLDANSVPNLNGWLEDCGMTQCQMAHMFRDGYGEQELETFRFFRARAVGGGAAWPAFQKPRRGPVRYQEAWRVASRTIRFPHWNYGFADSSYKLGAMLSPYWVTTNTSYMSLFGAEWTALKPSLVSEGMYLGGYNPEQAMGPGSYYPPTPTDTGAGSVGFQKGAFKKDQYAVPMADNAYGSYSNQNKHSVGRLPYGMPFTARAYTDPDTGRSPLNVNTCLNSGERMPTNVFGGTPAFALEAVFNIDSLRRIIKVGRFLDTDTINPRPGKWIDLRTTPWAMLSEHQKIKARNLATQLASQYQETLCRYFTATYRHTMDRKWKPFFNTAAPGQYEDFSDPGTYNQVYAKAGLYTLVQANQVRNYCKSWDYSKTRFPFGLQDFRRNVRDDLAVMASLAPNPSFTDQVSTDDFVNFDAKDIPEIAEGGLDKRSANAIFDNIVPGKPGQNGNPDWPASFQVTNDPLLELYRMQICRDETTESYADESYQSSGAGWGASGGVYSANPFLTLPQYDGYVGVYGYYRRSAPEDGLFDSGYLDPTGRALDLKAKGADFALLGGTADDGTGQPCAYLHELRTETPYRQQVFGPDWFSTELTTSTTTFLIVVNAQIVDDSYDPAHPRDIYSAQWGVVAEVCPDINVESPGNSGAGWPLGGGSTTVNGAGDLSGGSFNAASCGLGFYRGQWPWKLKTSRAIQDKNCGTLRTRHDTVTIDHANSADAAASAAGAPNHGSAALDYVDFRGVKQTDADSATSGYGGNRATQMHVVIRAMYSLNQMSGR